MILWCDGAHDASENMRRDAALLAAAQGGAEPVLRLFRFQPFGITLGLNQVPARELDLARCAADRVTWATRPTGGRAIFHAEEWTYALAGPIADPDWGGAQARAYERVGALLVASLVRLGVPARFDAGGGRSGRPRVAGGPADPCFASTARHEVTLAGRKLVGSAQRRAGTALLQQGSLLLGDGHLRLADYLPVSEPRRAAVRAMLREGTAHAGGRLGSDAPLERWADALQALLPGGTRRLDGAPGAFLLTPSKVGSYTSTSSQAES